MSVTLLHSLNIYEIAVADKLRSVENHLQKSYSYKNISSGFTKNNMEIAKNTVSSPVDSSTTRISDGPATS